ncbi:hypothetical protein [Streptomyces sp. SID486]|uniref:hypothetical protein n=1 Tax=Streptomyces sp. SID486 TaxID=2690264 RepID=UPI001928B8AD|nr:hypothetical protein [Streptomyces sp. SID486]
MANINYPPFRLPLSAVADEQHIFIPHRELARDPATGQLTTSRAILLIHTGQLLFSFPTAPTSHLTRGTAVAYVPYSNGRVQNFHPNIKDEHISTASTASLTSFEDRGADPPETEMIAAVDGARARLVKHDVGIFGSPIMLILQVQVASFYSTVWRVSYQVNVRIFGMHLSNDVWGWFEDPSKSLSPTFPARGF